MRTIREHSELRSQLSVTQILSYREHMFAFLILFAVAAQEPTAKQFLDEATRAFQRGDKATARRKLDEAQPLIDRDTEALRSRLAAHSRWDDCIKTNASRLASQNERADVLADAVLGICLDDETLVSVRQGDVDRYIEGLEGRALRDEVAKDMAEWRNIQRKTALAIIVNARSGADAH